MRRRLIGIARGFVVLARAPVPTGPLARADDAAAKIDPALRDLMAARPLSLLPVIVEMQQPVAPVVGRANVDRANQARELPRATGTPGAGLPLIDGAAGFATAAGITAMSLSPTVAYIHHDATIVPADATP